MFDKNKGEVINTLTRPIFRKVQSAGEDYFKDIFCLDLRSIGLYRIFLGFLLLPYIYTIWQESKLLLSKISPVPKEDLLINFTDGRIFFLFFTIENPVLVSIIFLISIIFAVFIIIGYNSKLSFFFLWFVLTCFTARNFFAIHSGDYLLNLMLFWSVFLPTDSYFSITKTRVRISETPTKHFSVGSVAVIMQFFIEYFSAGLSKTDPSWHDGSAAIRIIYSLTYSSDLAYYLQNLPNVFYLALSKIVVLGELILPFLLFLRIKNEWNRIFFLTFFVFFHIFIVLFMNLAFFPWTCLVFLILYLPGRFWGETFRRNKAVQIVRFRKWVEVFITCLIICVTVLNITAATTKNSFSNTSITYFKRIERAAGLGQHWKVFSPGPFDSNSWLVVKGILSDGSEVDIFRNGKPALEKMPENFIQVNSSFFWFKYFQNLYLFAWFRPKFANFLCENWNLNRSGAKRAEKVEVLYRYKKIDFPKKEISVIHEFKYIDFKCNGSTENDKENE